MNNVITVQLHPPVPRHGPGGHGQHARHQLRREQVQLLQLRQGRVSGLRKQGNTGHNGTMRVTRFKWLGHIVSVNGHSEQGHKYSQVITFYHQINL